LKELNMKSFCILIIKISNISWRRMCWIDVKLNGHYPCFNLCSWLPSRTTTRETKCFILSLILRALGGECRLRSIMWHHFQTWKPSTPSIISNS
jgi:hypothetical protein